MEGTICNLAEKRIAVVTGGNKGIGLEICRQLALNGVRVILTARDEKRGLEAVEKLRKRGLFDVLFHQLDVTDSSSIASFADFVKTEFGKLDVLVNNAGIGGLTVDFEILKAPKPSDNVVNNAGILGTESDSQRHGGGSSFFMSRETYKKAEECPNTNYYRAKKVTEALLPLLQLSQSPRIVNVSSVYGKLQIFGLKKKKKKEIERARVGIA